MSRPTAKKIEPGPSKLDSVLERIYEIKRHRAYEKEKLRQHLATQTCQYCGKTGCDVQLLIGPDKWHNYHRDCLIASLPPVPPHVHYYTEEYRKVLDDIIRKHQGLIQS